MSSKSNRFFTGFFSWLVAGRKRHAAGHGQKFYALLLYLGIVLVLSITWNGSSMASEHQNTASYDNVDARWLPWLGSWRLVSNKINTGENLSKQDYFLTIRPGSSDNSIIMKGNQADKVLVEEEIIADGLRHPLKDEKCSGYYSYSWSETGKRLLFNSESNCPGDAPRQISGMSIIDENRDWLDIQLLQNGTEKAISIRKYRNIDSGTAASLGFNPDKIDISRISAAKNFSIDEIIELSSKLEPEVIEAALLELRKPFPINSRQLVRLSDSGVNSRVVDLMVAFSFPDKFTVGQEAISLAQSRGGGPQGYNYPGYSMPYRDYSYYSYYCPILPWHWSSSAYMSYVYGYSYLGWYLTDGRYYPLWTWPSYYSYAPYYYPYYTGGGGGGPVRERGTLTRGRGYSPATGSSGSSSRYAQPRSAPAAQSQSVPVQSSSSFSSGGSAGGSVPTGSSSGGTPSASPQGYSSGRR